MTETTDSLIGTPDRPAAAPGPGGTDAVSDVLRLIRVSGAALLVGEFTAPWAWETPPAHAVARMLHPAARRTQLIIFHIVSEGACWVEVDGASRLLLQQGDVVGFPHGHAHRMGSARHAPVAQADGLAEAAPIPVASLFPPPPWTELPRLRCGGGGPPTRILCVYLHCDELAWNPLLASLPPMLAVRPDGSPASEWLATNVRHLISEATRGRAGTSCLTARLTELLFIELIRMHMDELEESAIGWFAALKDRHLGRALHAIHSRPSHPWTVPALARHIGLSRSALVQRFRDVLDTSPMRYLTAWRLQRAAQALRLNDISVGAAATLAGYGSEEAFSRAFKRHTGESPGNWRRLAQ